MEAIEPNLPPEPPDVDWSDLPIDIVETISKKLHDIFDFVYFRAVCKKWRSTTSISNLPPQLPWLLERPVNAEGIYGEILCFYSLFSDKIRTIHCPMACGKLLLGPSHGYLCASEMRNFDGNILSLLNPLIKDEVIIDSWRLSYPFLVSMVPDIIGSDDYMAFMDSDFETTGFYRPHNRQWNFVRLPLNVGFESCLKGMYYMNEIGTGNTLVFNIACGWSFRIPSPKALDSSDKVYFVESSGKILRIVKNVELSSPVSAPNFCFNIYQLDVEAEIDQCRWVKTNCIGNQILFLDGCSGISIKACPSTGLRGNCVYYTVSRYECSASQGLYKYNISDGKTEKVLCPFKEGRTWLVPNHVSFWPARHY